MVTACCSSYIERGIDLFIRLSVRKCVSVSSKLLNYCFDNNHQYLVVKWFSSCQKLKRSLLRNTQTQPAVPRDEDLQYGHQTVNYVTWEPFIHYLPPYIPPVPVQTGQPVSPSTYGLTWLYHIIIRAVPTVCPVVLSSVQTCSPVINPSVYCPTLLHAACVELVLHKYGCHGEHLSRWVGSRCRVVWGLKAHLLAWSQQRAALLPHVSNTVGHSWPLASWLPSGSGINSADGNKLPHKTSEGIICISYSFVLIL